jgi:hypothetical protein
MEGDCDDKREIFTTECPLVYGFIVSRMKMVNVSELSEKIRVSNIFKSATGRGLNEFPGMLVHTLTRDIAKSIDYTKYLVSRKIDGLRSMCAYIDGFTYLFFRNGTLWRSKYGKTKYSDFVVDVEFTIVDGNVKMTIFDAMYLDGVRMKQFVSHRLSALYDICDDFVYPDVIVEEQVYVQFRHACTLMTDEWEGLIFMKARSEYCVMYGDPVAYKYVRPSRLTVDLAVGAGKAYSYEGVYLYDTESPDGVYEFYLDGTVGKERFKSANNMLVIDTIRAVSNYTYDEMYSDVCLKPHTNRVVHRKKVVSGPQVWSGQPSPSLITDLPSDGSERQFLRSSKDIVRTRSPSDHSSSEGGTNRRRRRNRAFDKKRNGPPKIRGCGRRNGRRRAKRRSRGQRFGARGGGRNSSNERLSKRSCKPESSQDAVRRLTVRSTRSGKKCRSKRVKHAKASSGDQTSDLADRNGRKEWTKNPRLRKKGDVIEALVQDD